MSKHQEDLKAFADDLVKQIENNQAIWQKGWKTGERDILPVNHQGTPYRGENLIYLMTQAYRQGYADNRWYTYNNAQQHGGHVRKGEKGTVIKFYTNTQQRNKKDEHGNDVLDNDGKPIKETIRLERPIVKTAVVFNAEQIDGLPPRQLATPLSEWERQEKAEAIIKGIQSQGVTIEHKLGDKAYYSPSHDRIVMPERGQFETADVYYATLLHEIGHSTGHESRLNRDLSGAFGSESYAKEELRAEIASMIIGQELQIGYDPSQHVAYLEHWAKVIKEDPNEIFRAVKEAHEISDYVLGLGRNIDINEAEKEYPEKHDELKLAYGVESSEHEIFKVPDEIQEQFNKDVDRLNISLVSYPTPIQTKLPPVLLALDGVNGISVKDLTLELDRNTLHKMQGLVNGKQDDAHSLTIDDVKKLLNEIYNPVAVVQSDNGQGFVVLSSIKTQKGDPIVIPIHLEKQKGKYIFHDMASAYGNDRLEKWLNNSYDSKNLPDAQRWHRIVYYNQEKSLTIGTLPHLLEDKNLPVGVVSSKAYVDSVLNPDDVVKRYSEIIQNKLSNAQEMKQGLSHNREDKRIYLYTNFNDINKLMELKEQGIVRFDVQHQVWYAHESNKDKVAQWTTRPNVPTPEQEFVNFLQSKGINVTAGHPIFDEKTHRLSNDGSNAKNVMYQAYPNPNGVPFARVTNFSRGSEPENWQYPKEYLHILKNIEAVERAKGNQSYSHSQTVTIKTQQPIASKEPKELEQEKIAQQNLMAERAKMVMSFAPIAPKEQNYLARKQVTANDLVRIVPDSSKLPDNLKEHILIGDTPKQFSYLRENNPDKLVLQRGNLMIPQFNAQNELRAFETISYNGGKYALQGAEKQGLSTTLGNLENGKPIILVEGYATGATLYEQTKRNVVVAFGKNGLMDMAQILREQYPDSKIYIGADNDHQKVLENKPNIGLEDANKVAQTVSNTYVLVPQFDEKDTGKDWNDILVDKGADTLKYQLQIQLNAINPPKNPVEKTDKKVEPNITNSQHQENSKDPLDIKNIKENHPNMSEENMKSIQQWREYLPIKFANEPIKYEIAVNRLVDKLPDLANGETLNPPPKPEQIQERKPPDTPDTGR